MLTLKGDVQLKKLSTHILLADLVVALVYAKHGLDCEITSGTEGDHKMDSKHCTGDAHDFKTRHVPSNLLTPILDETTDALPGYRVIYEGPSKPKGWPDAFFIHSEAPHMHVEFHPEYEMTA
jgi:hypothetical protein